MKTALSIAALVLALASAATSAWWVDQRLTPRLAGHEQQLARALAAIEQLQADLRQRDLRLAHLEKTSTALIGLTSRTIDQQVRDQKARFELQADLDRLKTSP
jgi:type II secretory pathway component PulK